MVPSLQTGILSIACMVIHIVATLPFAMRYLIWSHPAPLRFELDYVWVRGSQRWFLYWLTNSVLVYEPKCRGGGGGSGVSTNEHRCAQLSPNKLWRSNSIFNLLVCVKVSATINVDSSVNLHPKYQYIRLFVCVSADGIWKAGKYWRGYVAVFLWQSG
jgi:hypothetical protein